MPPRKRTASAAEAAKEPETPEAEQPQNETPEQPEADGPASEEAQTAPATETEDDTPDDPKSDDATERSDLQTVEQPCPECMPNGWPDGAFSVGCTHGTWVRDNA